MGLSGNILQKLGNILSPFSSPLIKGNLLKLLHGVQTLNPRERLHLLHADHVL